MTSATLIPRKWTLINYTRLFTSKTPIRNFPAFIANSLIVCAYTTIVATIISIFGAFGLSNIEKNPKSSVGGSYYLYISSQHQ